MWDFFKCLLLSFFPAFFLFALLCVATAESTFTSGREELFAFLFNLAIFIGMIVLQMYVMKTVNGMW